MEDGVKQSDDLRMFNRGWVATLLAVFVSVMGTASGASAQGPRRST